MIGQVSALIISLAFLASATYLVATGSPVAGTILGTVDIVALAAVFLTLGRSASVVSGDAAEAPDRRVVPTKTDDVTHREAETIDSR